MTHLVLGAYRPGSTFLHRLRPGAKLLALIIGASLAMAFRSAPGAAVSLAVTITLGWIAGIGIRGLWRTLMRFAIVAVILFAFQLWQNGLATAFAIVGTLFALLLAANVFTATTRVEDLLDTVIWALTPLKRIGVKPERVALAFSLVIRTIPEVLQIANESRDAARARGVERSLRARLVPLLLRTVSRAQMTGDALTARGITDDE